MLTEPARLSLICPTIGRTTLWRMAWSALSQMQATDELIVVVDGPIPPEGEESLERLGDIITPPVKVIRLPERVGDFGCTPCDVGIEAATGDAVFFIGDDDICTPNAFEDIRRVVTEYPDRPHVFSMHHFIGLLRNSIEYCSVSGQQIVVPRDMTKMPKMSDVPKSQWNMSDYVFIKKVHEAWHCTTMFHDEIIAILEQQHNGAYL